MDYSLEPAVSPVKTLEVPIPPTPENHVLQAHAPPRLDGFMLRSHLWRLIRWARDTHGSQVTEDLDWIHLRERTRTGDEKNALHRELRSTIHVQNDANIWLDLRPYMNRSPFVVQTHTSLHQIYRLFRSLGLRHLCVVDEHTSYECVGILTRTDLTFKSNKHKFYKD